MTDDDSIDALLDLRELAVLAFLHGGVRLLPCWGYCPSCGLTASTAVRWCGVTWAVCSPCSVRWSVPDDGAFRPELEPVPDDRLEEIMELLADCHYLHPIGEIPSPDPITTVTIPERSIDPMARQTTPPSFGIDPQKFQQPRDLLALYPLPQRFRILLTDVILNDMVAHPPFGRHPVTGAVILPAGADMRCWHRVRDVVVDPAGPLQTFGQILNSDPLVSPFAIRGVMELFGKLRQRRAELEEQLRDLDAIAAVFAPGAEEKITA